jgi:hypothetical protein
MDRERDIERGRELKREREEREEREREERGERVPRREERRERRGGIGCSSLSILLPISALSLLESPSVCPHLHHLRLWTTKGMAS